MLKTREIPRCMYGHIELCKQETNPCNFIRDIRNAIEYNGTGKKSRFTFNPNDKIAESLAFAAPCSSAYDQEEMHYSISDDKLEVNITFMTYNAMITHNKVRSENHLKPIPFNKTKSKCNTIFILCETCYDTMGEEQSNYRFIELIKSFCSAIFGEINRIRISCDSTNGNILIKDYGGYSISMYMFIRSLKVDGNGYKYKICELSKYKKNGTLFIFYR